jgi:hypothetical protein
MISSVQNDEREIQLEEDAPENDVEAVINPAWLQVMLRVTHMLSRCRRMAPGCAFQSCMAVLTPSFSNG